MRFLLNTAVIALPFSLAGCMNAFVENYRREPMFADSLDEFDDSRDVVQSLRDEYIAAESPDYVEWGVGEEDDAGGLLDDGGGAFASDA